MDSWPRMDRRRRIACSPFNHILQSRNAPFWIKIVLSKSGLTWLKSKMGPSLVFMNSTVAVGAAISCLFTLCQAFQLSDSKLEGSVLGFLAKFFFLSSSSITTVPKSTSLPLIWFCRKKKGIVAFDSPRCCRFEGHLFTRRVAMCEALFHRCCLITSVSGTDAEMWGCVRYLVGYKKSHTVFVCVHICESVLNTICQNIMKGDNRMGLAEGFGIEASHIWLFSYSRVLNNFPLVSTSTNNSLCSSLSLSMDLSSCQMRPGKLLTLISLFASFFLFGFGTTVNEGHWLTRDLAKC